MKTLESRKRAFTRTRFGVVGALIVALFVCAAAGSAAGQALPLDCASQISAGSVIDFEQPGAMTVNDVLPDFDMAASPDEIITTMVFWVTGNVCAPIANQAGFSDAFVISTTGDPWGKVGLSVLGTQLGVDRELTLNVFDVDGSLLGSVTQTFSPGNTQDEYNAAVVFLGFESPVAIHSFQVLADNPNIAWDEIRFEPFGGGGTDPEFLRGDADADGSVNGLVDGLFVLSYQFIAGSPGPPCFDAADTDDSGSVNGLVDGLALLNYQFVPGSPPPPAPGPDGCGVDPTDDALDCLLACP